MQRWKYNTSLQNMVIVVTLVAMVASVVSPLWLYDELMERFDMDHAHARLANLATSLLVIPILPTEGSCRDVTVPFIEDWFHLCSTGSGLFAEFIGANHETLWRSPSSFVLDRDHKRRALRIPKGAQCGESTRSGYRRLVIDDIPYIAFDLYVKGGAFRSSVAGRSVCLVQVVGRESTLFTRIDIRTVLRALIREKKGIQEAKSLQVTHWLVTVGSATLPPLLMGAFFLWNIRFWFRRTVREFLFVARNQSFSDYPSEIRILLLKVFESIRNQVAKNEEILRFLLEFRIFYHEHFRDISDMADLLYGEVRKGRREAEYHTGVVSRVRDGLKQLHRRCDEEAIPSASQFMDESNLWFRRYGEVADVRDATKEVHSEFEELAKEKGQNIQFCLKWEGTRWSDKSGESVRMAKSHVRMIVGNFLRNAVTWTESDIRTTITAENSILEFMVEDNGPGFVRNGRKMRNSRVVWSLGGKLPSDDAKGQVEGLGLGLFIVQELTKTYGGTVFAGTGELGGARFVARLILDSDPRPLSGQV